MKGRLSKFLTIGLSILCLCGCSINLNNTPTKQAEIFLGKYQTLHSDVLEDLDNVIAEEENFFTEQRDEYRKIMKQHYQDLEYEIKEEMIDGKSATVTVEIEVNDYSKVMDKASQKLIDSPEEFNDETGNYSHSKYIDYQLDLMDDTKDRVTYTLDLTFTKKDDEWVIDNLSTTDMDKINGVYIYE